MALVEIFRGEFWIWAAGFIVMAFSAENIFGLAGLFFACGLFLLLGILLTNIKSLILEIQQLSTKEATA